MDKLCSYLVKQIHLIPKYEDHWLDNTKNYNTLFLCYLVDIWFIRFNYYIAKTFIQKQYHNRTTTTLNYYNTAVVFTIDSLKIEAFGTKREKQLENCRASIILTYIPYCNMCSSLKHREKTFI